MRFAAVVLFAGAVMAHGMEDDTYESIPVEYPEETPVETPVETPIQSPPVVSTPTDYPEYPETSTTSTTTTYEESPVETPGENPDSTYWETQYTTITSCAPEVDDCPNHHGHTSTSSSSSTESESTPTSTYETTSNGPTGVPPVETTPVQPPPGDNGSTPNKPNPPGQSSPGPCFSLSIETIQTTYTTEYTTLPTVIYSTHEVTCAGITTTAPGVPGVTPVPTIPTTPGTTFVPTVTKSPMPSAPPYVDGAATFGASVALAAVAGVVAMML